MRHLTSSFFALLVVGLIAIPLLIPPLKAQTVCAVRVDLRWFSPPDTVVRGPDGAVLTTPTELGTFRFIQQGVGETYWQEAAKKKFPDICLDQDRADYFVFWTNVQHVTGVHVYPRSEAGCAVEKMVFQTAKENNDEERSAKQAFSDTMEFLRRLGKVPETSGLGCVSPEEIKPGDDTPARSNSVEQQSPAPQSAQRGNQTQTQLEITSSPSGADIEMDGKFAGSTPSSISIPVGEHSLTITKKGYLHWERKINALAGRVSVAAELEAEAKPAQ